MLIIRNYNADRQDIPSEKSYGCFTESTCKWFRDHFLGSGQHLGSGGAIGAKLLEALRILSRHTSLNKRCFNVDIWWRRWTAYFQRWINVVKIQRQINVVTTLKFHVVFGLKSQSNVVLTLKSDVTSITISNLFQRWEVMLIQHWNNVDVPAGYFLL